MRRSPRVWEERMNMVKNVVKAAKKAAKDLKEEVIPPPAKLLNNLPGTPREFENTKEVAAYVYEHGAELNPDQLAFVEGKLYDVRYGGEESFENFYKFLPSLSVAKHFERLM